MRRRPPISAVSRRPSRPRTSWALAPYPNVRATRKRSMPVRHVSPCHGLAAQMSSAASSMRSGSSSASSTVACDQSSGSASRAASQASTSVSMHPIVLGGPRSRSLCGVRLWPARFPGRNITQGEPFLMDVDVTVLGGGPGGYPAAIRASQLGLSVAVIEQGRLGGTCLNVGCIPTKALVQSAHAVHDAHTTFAQLGVKVSGVEIDWPQMQANKQQVVDGSVSGLGGLLKANGITVVEGRGRFTGANTLEVEGGESVTFKHAVIASGSRPLRPPIEGIDHPRCVDSTGLLEIDRVPPRLVVIGGGVIGCEFASIFSHL